MIYTVTVNPSIDYIVQLNELTLGEVNRMDYDNKLPGGKGINVSRILKELGLDNTAWGFLGGFTGEFVKETLEKTGLKTNFTPIKADTRINVKIKAQAETEINGRGPELTKEEIAAFTAQFDKLTADDVVIFAGSLVPSLSDDFYFDLIKVIRQKGAQFVIDTTGESLLKTLPENPLVVKPNNHELAELFGVELNSIDDIVKYAPASLLPLTVAFPAGNAAPDIFISHMDDLRLNAFRLQSLCQLRQRRVSTSVSPWASVYK